MAKITYEYKEAINQNSQIPDVNKVNASDMNQIKATVNANDDKVGELSDLDTTDKSSIVGAINSVVLSGSNTNGNYVKYADGTAIVWGTESISFNANTSTYNTINLLITFKNTNYIVTESISKLFNYHTAITLHPGTRTTTTCQIGGWNDSSSTINGYIDYIIIGKWK